MGETNWNKDIYFQMKAINIFPEESQVIYQKNAGL